MNYFDRIEQMQNRDSKRVQSLRDAVVNAQIRLQYAERKSPLVRKLLEDLNAALAADDALFESSLLALSNG